MRIRIAEALRDAARRLESTSDTARLDAELLMAHALGVSRSDLLLRHTADAAPAAFETLVGRRAAQEPVAHIVGRQEFYGLTFEVTPDVLIPRPDSETTLAAAFEAAPAAKRVLDCGTGSGALLLAYLNEVPSAVGIGVDASSAALAVARRNGEALGLSDRTTFLQRDWRAGGWRDELGSFDLVLANPPYVEDKADLPPSVREFEPAQALFAGPEGLDDYRVLIPQLGELLSQEGAAVFEIGAGQADAVSEIAASERFATELRHDLAGRPRALILRRNC